ncbi:SPFH domain-containing protein [Deinococcus roseus]|uniref:Membrane protein n=1 Tax=Deinococcus roseus TaxID=392414 RepID=A0ABQ2DCG3_9DEIO|nr:SPFH domain-containing protein [Deinococcus roseus]GGJ53255.1 membrane protein [Deinococcus roseus]
MEITIFTIVIVVLAVIILMRGVVIVPQGYQYTVERFGKYVKSLEPGFSVLVPVMEQVGRRVNMMEQVLDVPSQEVITKDNALVKVDGVVFYQVLNAAKASYEVSGLKNAIMALTQTNIRTVMGSLDLDELLSKRDEINARLLAVVDEATEPWGVKVTRIEIKDITPPADLVESMGRQMKAERDKRALVLEAEGAKQSAVLRAEGARQAAILEAEGKRQAQILEAEASKQAAFLAAEARERQAEAEARATNLVSDAIAKGGVQAINYFVATRYTEALEKMASAGNHKIIMMPLEASNVIGALGGIAKLAQETFKE